MASLSSSLESVTRACSPLQVPIGFNFCISVHSIEAWTWKRNCSPSWMNSPGPNCFAWDRTTNSWSNLISLAVGWANGWRIENQFAWELKIDIQTASNRTGIKKLEQLRSLSLSTWIGQDETDCCKLFTLPSAKSWGSPWRYVEPLERQVSLMASHDRYIRERRTTTHDPTHHHIRLISIVSICLLLRYPRVKYEIYFSLHPSQNH